MKDNHVELESIYVSIASKSNTQGRRKLSKSEKTFLDVYCTWGILLVDGLHNVLVSEYPGEVFDVIIEAFHDAGLPDVAGDFAEACNLLLIHLTEDRPDEEADADAFRKHYRDELNNIEARLYSKQNRVMEQLLKYWKSKKPQ